MDNFTINFDNMPLFKVVSLIQVVSRQVLIGSTMSTVLGKYYDLDDYKNSEIFKSKDKEYIREFFNKLISVTQITEEELDICLNFIKDTNKMDLRLCKGLEQGVVFLKAMERLFTELWLYEINLPAGTDEELVEFAKQKPTLSNYLYLKQAKNIL